MPFFVLPPFVRPRFVAWTALGLFLAAVLAACGGQTQGVFVGKFSDEGVISRIKFDLSSKHLVHTFAFSGRNGKGNCRFAFGLESVALIPGLCDQIHGTGTISCDNGYSRPVNWRLASCHGGFGLTPNLSAPGFYFGFDHNVERAMDQLEYALRQE